MITRKNKLSKNSITHKLIFIFIISFCLPLIMFNGVWYIKNYRVARQNFDIQVTNAMRTAQTEVNFKVSELTTVARTISTNSLIVKYFQNYSVDPIPYFLSSMWDLGPFITNISEINPIIESMRIYALDETIPRYQNSIYSQSIMKEQPWMKAVELLEYNESLLYKSQFLYEAQTKENIQQLLFPTGVYNPRVFSLFLNIYSTYNQKPIAYLELITNKDFLLDISGSPVEGGSMFFQEEGTGIIYAQNDVKNIAENVNAYLLQDMDNTDHIIFDGEKYYIRTLKIDEPKLTLIYTCPYSVIFARAQNELNTIQIMILLSITLFIFFFLAAFRSIPDRLHILVAGMEGIRMGKTNISFADDHNDEISQVNLTLSQLLDHINDLINTVYKVELAEKDATLSYLRAQIEPHFLFNALEAIRMMSTLGKHERVADALVALSNILRVRLTSNEKITLGEELFVIQSYVQVENVRCNDLIMLSIMADESLFDIKIPSLIIQPLVENAIRHAFRSDKSFLLIKLDILCEGFSNMLIQVTDDGGGMSTIRLEQVISHLSSGTAMPQQGGSGVGLTNISHRLQLYYGDRASLELKSIPNSGTEIVLRIPIEE